MFIHFWLIICFGNLILGSFVGFVYCLMHLFHSTFDATQRPIMVYGTVVCQGGPKVQ